MRNQRLNQWIHNLTLNIQNINEHIHHLELQRHTDTKILGRLYKFLESQTDFVECLRRLLFTNSKPIPSIKPL